MSARGRTGATVPGLAVVLVLLALGALGVARGAPDGPAAVLPSPTLQEAPEDPFPHADHEGMFPLCTGCHLDPALGAEAPLYPEPASCTSCHDGVEAEVVEWDGPTAKPSNLDYDHVVHDREMEAEGDELLACSSCHEEEGTVRMVTVEPAEADECLDCHAHEADEHYVTAECTTCHVDVVEAELPPDRLAAFPVPEDHEVEDYILLHHGEVEVEDVGRCATCHVQDQCAACHLNVRELEAIAALPGGPAPEGLVALETEYPTPATHEVGRWLDHHGRDLDASTAATECATCHSRQDCAACHVLPPRGSPGLVDLEAEARRVREAPTTQQVRAPGVELAGEAPESHESPFWNERHGSPSASEVARCTTCHMESSFCAECHEGEATAGGYHPPRFLTRHAADAAAQMSQCSTCHDAAVFCRSCHVESGLGGSGRLDAGYHDGEAVWLLRHGQAARQQLETCASCHTQRQCLQCHSQLGAFQVSPHGPDFDSRRAWERNPVVCRACHLSNPFGGGS